MAFDLLAAPASSSADERTFSKAGRVLDGDRWHTKDDLAQAEQCLRSAIDDGIEFHYVDGDGDVVPVEWPGIDQSDHCTHCGTLTRHSNLN